MGARGRAGKTLEIFLLPLVRMEARETFDRTKSRYIIVKKLLLGLSLGPLILGLGVPNGQTSRNATHVLPTGEEKNWLFVTLTILWTCMTFILLFLENRLFRIYKCMLKRGVYALQGNLEFSGGFSDMFKQCAKFMYISDETSDFTAGCEANGIGVDEVDRKSGIDPCASDPYITTSV